MIQEAEENTAAFRWSKAAQAFQRYLMTVTYSDQIERGKILERIGQCYYYSAMQSPTRASFRSKLSDALSWNLRAQSCFDSSGGPRNGYSLRSLAMKAYLSHWQASSPRVKKRYLDESWKFTKQALFSFETSKQYAEFAQTFNQLSLGGAIGIEFGWSVPARVKTLTDAVKLGRKSVGILRSGGKVRELTISLVRTALFLDGLAECISDQGRIKEYEREAGELWEEALRKSRPVALYEFCLPPLGFHRLLNPAVSLKICREALPIVKRTRDNFVIGFCLDKTTKWTFYKAESSESKAQSLKTHLEALLLAESAAARYDKVNFTSPDDGVYWVHSPYAEYFSQTGSYETDREKRLSVQEKSVRNTKELIRLAVKSRIPQILMYAYHVSARANLVLAGLETNPKRKRELIRTALKQRIISVRMAHLVEPQFSWNGAALKLNLADNQAKLADVETSVQRQKELLLAAFRNSETGLKDTTAFVQLFENPEKHILNNQIGLFHRQNGKRLARLFGLTRNERYLRRAAQEYVAAAGNYRGLGQNKKLGESHWKAAEIYDQLQSLSLAAENFGLASDAYAELGNQVPALKEHSHDYSSYMKAWSQIEQARLDHGEFRYAKAARLFGSAARLHRSTKRWSFLAPYYLAWSKLEMGEDLSITGNHMRAIERFREAAGLFKDSRFMSKRRVALLDLPDERVMVAKLVDTPSETYCDARVVLEEAVVAESGEDYRASVEKFGLASEKFAEVADRSQSESDRTVAGFLSVLCQAWHLSDKAQLDDSEQPLEKACALFSRAMRISINERARMLAAGHEAFTKGLIASRKFATKREEGAHREASRQFDLAATYYRDSGFRTASYHAIARKLLLDASAHLNDASGEPNQGRRVEHYQIATKLLEESASNFLKAQLPRKREQSLGLLEKTRMESKIAGELTEILDAASDSRANVAFQSPGRGDEIAVGLDRFETPDIEARLSKVTKIVGSKREFELEIEVLNIGDRPLTLARVEAIPEGPGPGDFDVRDGGISLEGHRLGPASVESVKFTIRTTPEGLVGIRPRIVFRDESGVEHGRIMEQVIVPSSPMVEWLADSFVTDYAERRLAEANCGWRTLMEIVNALKIPRSNVYGEPRYGRMFGKQLESLIKSSLVEYRIFPGERGRGGDITKVRVLLKTEIVRSHVEQLIAAQTQAENPGASALVRVPLFAPDN